jgi:hypothetical protein
MISEKNQGGNPIPGGSKFQILLELLEEQRHSVNVWVKYKQVQGEFRTRVKTHFQHCIHVTNK